MRQFQSIEAPQRVRAIVRYHMHKTLLENICVTEQSVVLAFVYDSEDELVKTRLAGDAEKESNLSDLKPEERELLEECEKEINENFDAISIVGYRLYQIQTQKLYRATHKTFASYCKEKWGISRVHAKRLIKYDTGIEAVKKAANQIGSPVALPQNEYGFRSIADLKMDQQLEVCKAVYEIQGDDFDNHDFVEMRNKLYPKVAAPAANKAKSGKAKHRGEEHTNDSDQAAAFLGSAKQGTFAALYKTVEELEAAFGNPLKQSEVKQLIKTLKKAIAECMDAESAPSSVRKVEKEPCLV